MTTRIPLLALLVLAFFAGSTSAVETPETPAGNPGNPVRAVLIVKPYAGGAFSNSLSGIGSRLRSELTGHRFTIVDPGDCLGTAQNCAADGGAAPSATDVNLALVCEGDLLIRASVDNASLDVIGAPGPRQRQLAQMTMTLSAVRLPQGDSVVSETFTGKSDSVSADLFPARADALCEQAVERLVRGAAKKFLASCEAEEVWTKVSAPDYITVGFGCNLPGANVLLDGFSRGTAGSPGTEVLRLRTWRGIHHVTISGDFMRAFDTEALLEDGTTFLAVLKETDEGRRVREGDRQFDLMMERIEKGGATDDDVRLLAAEGYSRYLSGSHVCLEGIPSVLDSVAFLPGRSDATLIPSPPIP